VKLVNPCKLTIYSSTPKKLVEAAASRLGFIALKPTASSAVAALYNIYAVGIKR